MKPPLYGAYKIGELAEEAEVSVRTLHYYEEIGLLTPSARTGSGHRLYSLEDALRLQQIKTLQGMGFSLEEIGQCLDEPEYSPVPLLRKKVEHVSAQLQQMEQLRDQLTAIVKQFDEQEEATTEQILKAYKEMTLFEKYYTKEQLDELAQRREQYGDERMLQVQQEWQDLHNAMTQALKDGLDPSSEEAQNLGRKWRSLIDEFTGGNPGIEASLKNFYQDNPNYLEQYGYKTEPGLNEYVQKVLEKLM